MTKLTEPSYDDISLFESEFALVLPGAHSLFPELTGLIGVIESVIGKDGVIILIRGELYTLPAACVRSMPDDMIELFNYNDGKPGYKFKLSAKKDIVEQDKSWMLIGTPAFDYACKMSLLATQSRKVQTTSRKVQAAQSRRAEVTQFKSEQFFNQYLTNTKE